MRISMTILFVLLLGKLYSQQANCKDSLRQPDEFFQCGIYAGGEEYEPVCGCDFVTYRNACAAENWGGLINNGFIRGWTEGICGNFHFDFRPTLITLSPAKFQVYVRNLGFQSIPVSVFIYDSFGKLEFTWYDVVSQDGLFPYPNPLELQVQTFKRGIYMLVVVVNNEKQSMKFVKATD